MKAATGAHGLPTSSSVGNLSLSRPSFSGSTLSTTSPTTTPAILSFILRPRLSLASHRAAALVFPARVELRGVAAATDRVRRLGDEIRAAEARAESEDLNQLAGAQIRQADCRGRGLDHLLLLVRKDCQGALIRLVLREDRLVHDHVLVRVALLEKLVEVFVAVELRVVERGLPLNLLF